MKQRSFFDTNIIVYAHDSRDQNKHRVAQSLLRSAIADETAVISSQVVQEFCHVALIKKAASLRPDDLEAVLDKILLPLMLHTPTTNFYKRALEMFARQSLSFYDTLIIQAALDLGCRTLYSEDLQPDQTFGKLKVVNPFKG